MNRLQVFIYFSLCGSARPSLTSNTCEGTKELDINLLTLIISIFTSIITLAINIYTIWKDKRFNGMSISYYVLSVLQLSQIALPTFVPQIGILRKGKLKTVNWTNYQFTNESYVPISNVLNSFNLNKSYKQFFNSKKNSYSNSSSLSKHTKSPKSPKTRRKNYLKNVLISLYSLSKRDFTYETARDFGNLLKQNNIKLIISMSADANQVKKLFYILANGKKNTNFIEKEDFIKNLHLINSDFDDFDESDKEKIFNNITITHKNKLYSFDFFNSVLSLDRNEGDKKKNKHQINILQLFYPIHHCFEKIKNLFDIIINDKNNDINSKNTQKILLNMDRTIHTLRNLFYISQATGQQYVCKTNYVLV